VFNQELQQSVTDYIHDHRLGEAADLLRKTNLSIQSIAVYVGYADTNYFSRLFSPPLSNNTDRLSQKFRLDRP